MPRSMWSGAISFGLVNVPVRLFSGVRDVGLHFRQLHGADGAPIDTRRFCAEEGVEIPYEEIAHGYELEDGRQVIVTGDDLATVAPRKTRTIDIEAFVDVADVDPIQLDHPYFLAPVGESEGTLRAYQLLVDVLGETGRAALGRVVLRTKEYLVLVRVRDGRLALSTLLFHDEVRPRDEIAPGGEAPEEDRVAEAVALVDALTVDWDPAAHRDCHRERLEAVIERKQAGERITLPEPAEQPKPAVDLMAALRKSLEEVSQRSPARGGGAPAEDLGSLTREQLYERAQEANVEGRSSMTKRELVEALGG